MLNIRIIAVGKDKEKWVHDGCAHYQKLLSRYASVTINIIPSAKQPSLPREQIKQEEGKRILKALDKGTVIALADSGKQTDSKGFAVLLEKLQQTSGGTVSFILGGAFGLDKAVYDRADSILSLSSLTFSHQLVRQVLLEQLYRGFSIIYGTDYHK